MESDLKRIFSYDTFRPGQKDIIESILNKNDILTLMPTGAGKSLCYQLPAILSNGLTIVISPLISLIHDQIECLKKLDVCCYHLNSTTSGKDIIKIWKLLTDATKPNIKKSECKLVYTTPETMVDNEDFMLLIDRIYENNLLEGFVIDEAHCVSNWGHDFRPSYLELCTLKEYYPGTPIWAFTATATPVVRKDILHQLRMESDAIIWSSSFIRENLCYKIIPKNFSSIKEDIASLIKIKYSGMSGIVYCLSRKDCEKYAEFLLAHGISARYYHAKLDPLDKTKIQDAWINNKIDVIVATIAFALGINKPDVRFVIHAAMPRSIESYYQEAGRAGRDLKYSDCIMYYSYGDKAILDKMTRDSKSEIERDPIYVAKMLQNISSIYNLATNNVCIKRQFSNYLGEYIDYQCQDGTNKCGICATKKHQLSPINMLDITKKIMTMIPRERIYLINTIAKNSTLNKTNAGNLVDYLVVKGILKVEVKVEAGDEGMNETIYIGDKPFTDTDIVRPPQSHIATVVKATDDKDKLMWDDPSVKKLMELLENGSLQ